MIKLIVLIVVFLSISLAGIIPNKHTNLSIYSIPLPKQPCHFGLIGKDDEGYFPYAVGDVKQLVPSSGARIYAQPSAPPSRALKAHPFNKIPRA